MPATALRTSVTAALLFVSMALEAGGADIYVPDDYGEIQAAIAAAQDGDTVIVRPGMYLEWIDFLGKAITVKSSHGPLMTTIRPRDNSMGRSIVEFRSGEDRDSVLDGFTITGAIYGAYIPGTGSCGGGVLCYHAAPTISNNIIRDNGGDVSGWPWVQYGGGICVWGGDALIVGNVITGNQADFGGGIYSDCVVYANDPIIAHNLIAGNQGARGGGAFLESSADFTGNVVRDNQAIDQGGGVWCSEDWTSTNNTIIGNRAGVHGGGIMYRVPPSISVFNSIVRDNSAPSGAQIGLSYVTAVHCNIEGGWPNGSGNIDADPLFVDRAAGDLHLRYDSPCRNTGTTTFPGLPTRDFEGDPRTADGAWDIGADEFYPHLYYLRGYLAGPGYLDDREIDIRIVGQPGTSSVTLALSSQLYDPPVSTAFGDLYLQPPLLARQLGPIPAGGVLALTTTYPSSWTEGDRYFFQALVGPAAPGSLLTNLMTLTVVPAPEPIPRLKY